MTTGFQLQRRRILVSEQILLEEVMTPVYMQRTEYFSGSRQETASLEGGGLMKMTIHKTIFDFGDRHLCDESLLSGRMNVA
jgi:hypothetical protein